MSIIITNLFSIISLPMVLGYFMPIHPYFGLQNPDPPIQHSIIGIPLFVDESGNLYPNLGENFVPFPGPYVGPFPLKNALKDAILDDVIMDDVTLDDVNSDDVTSDDVVSDDVTSDDVIKGGEFQGKSIFPIVFDSNLLRKITAFDITFNKEEEDPLVEKCRKTFGGTLVNNECYKYYDHELTFEDAREFCQEEGGDLWTPDPMDAFLYYKLGYLMPEFGNAGKDDLLIGAKVEHNGHKVFTIDKEDITDTFLMNINDGYNHRECIALSFEQGGFVTHGQSCHDDDEFMCEYPLEERHHKPTFIDSVFDSLTHKISAYDRLIG